MEKRYAMFGGVLLIGLGLLGLAYNVLGSFLDLPWRMVRFWPLLVIAGGLAFVAAPLLGGRKWGALFIPGMPILIVGGVLLFGSLFRWWFVWHWAWPLVILGVALGFFLAALWMRNRWLLLPGIIIAANGAVFLLCALTGMWRLWAILWTVEPLSVGVGLLAVNLTEQRRGLNTAGLILCGIAAVGMIGMSAVVRGVWLLNLVGPALLVLVGFVLLVSGLVRPAASRTHEPVAGIER